MVYGQLRLNIGNIFGQSWLNFWDYVQTVQAEISGLFLGNFRLSSGLVLIPRPMFLGFVVYFGIIIIQ